MVRAPRLAEPPARGRCRPAGAAAALAVALALGGCGDLALPWGRRAPPPAAPAAAPAAPAPAGQSAAALDTTTAAERTAATAASAIAGERALGTARVSLGNPAEGGFWLRGEVVKAPGKGRVVAPDGRAVAVDLIPGAGAAQLSLAAFRALGLPLTGLPEVRVFAR